MGFGAVSSQTPHYTSCFFTFKNIAMTDETLYSVKNYVKCVKLNQCYFKPCHVVVPLGASNHPSLCSDFDNTGHQLELDLYQAKYLDESMITTANQSAGGRASKKPSRVKAKSMVQVFGNQRLFFRCPTWNPLVESVAFLLLFLVKLTSVSPEQMGFLLGKNWYSNVINIEWPWKVSMKRISGATKYNDLFIVFMYLASLCFSFETVNTDIKLFCIPLRHFFWLRPVGPNLWTSSKRITRHPCEIQLWKSCSLNPYQNSYLVSKSWDNPKHAFLGLWIYQTLWPRCQ